MLRRLCPACVPYALRSRNVLLLRMLLTMRGTAADDGAGKAAHTVRIRARGNASASGRDTGGQPDGVPIEEIVKKGLDIAEAGIGIGFNIATRLGGIFKEQFLERINSSEILRAVAGQQAAGPQQTPQAAEGREHHAGASQAPPTDEAMAPAYYLHNRLPLHQGGEAMISFSINNDSLLEEKTIRIAVEGFVGEARHVQLDAGTFAVVPAEISIAPADFEKFVLKGKIPYGLPADHYHGWLIVSEQEVYRIPVILAVSASDRTSTETTAS